MSLVALALVLVAAVMHAGWNLVVKQAGQKQVFMWWALVAGVLCFLPVFWFSAHLPLNIWPYVLSSAAMEAVYFIALTRAYDIDDFSLVYPVARGSAPALLIVWTTLFLHEPPRVTGLLGILVLVTGLVVVGGSGFWSRVGTAGLSRKGVFVALLAAISISIYSAIDGAAVRVVSPAPYTVLVLAVTALLVAPAVAVRYGLSAVRAELRHNWWGILFVGFCMLLTYVLVLQAYAIGKVSYAGSVRESSVVFAALIGWRWLGEGFGVARTTGSLLIFAGIVMIAILG